MSQPEFISLKCVPPLNVAQATDNRLSLRPAEDAGEGIAVHVGPWPFMALSNTVTLHVCGTRNDHSPFMLRVAYAEPVTEVETSEGWQRTIPWEVFGELRHDSSLVFVFQVAFDDCCGACPLLFAPLSLRVSVPWQDLTTFTDSDFNGWEIGPAAADPRDLLVIRAGDNYVLANRTYTSNSSGVVLSKTYTDLRVGEVYEFSMATRRSNTSHTAPILALYADATVVAGPLDILTTTWATLRGQFTPGSATMTLTIVSENSTGQGNDYELDDIILRTV